VEHVRLDPERGESFHAADPEHDFLAHAHLEIAAIKLAVMRRSSGLFLGNVGVEEIDVHAPDA
jgi:hypothetical protein